MIIVTFAIAISADCPNTPRGTCPPVDRIGHTVLLPNANSCRCYFSCSNGVPISMECPEGLHFSDELDVCMFPKDANCCYNGCFSNGNGCTCHGDHPYYREATR